MLVLTISFKYFTLIIKFNKLIKLNIGWFLTVGYMITKSVPLSNMKHFTNEIRMLHHSTKLGFSASMSLQVESH